MKNSNSSEFKGKLEIDKNSASEFDTRSIDIAQLLTKFDSTKRFSYHFVKSSAKLINLVSNSAAEFLSISKFPLDSDELLYDNCQKKLHNYGFTHA
jgi:hypothetical protein